MFITTRADNKRFMDFLFISIYPFNMAGDIMLYDDICKKLGFDPQTESYNFSYSGHEDDSELSPFKRLTQEEMEYLAQTVFNKQQNT